MPMLTSYVNAFKGYVTTGMKSHTYESAFERLISQQIILKTRDAPENDQKPSNHVNENPNLTE